MTEVIIICVTAFLIGAMLCDTLKQIQFIKKIDIKEENESEEK